MKMIQLIIVILLAFGFQPANATFDYQFGDTLNVWAVSGLNMREGPGTDFPKMKKLEYGDRVEVIDSYLQSTPLSLTIVKKAKKNDAFIMNGFWVRVKIGTQEGYVFDGYLSRLPVMELGPNRSMHAYLEKYFEQIKHESTHEENSNQYDEKYYYENNITCYSGGGEGCGWFGVELADFSLNEVYLLFNMNTQFEKYVSDFHSNKAMDEYDYDRYLISKKKDGTIIFALQSELSYVSLSFKDGQFKIESEGCC